MLTAAAPAAGSEKLMRIFPSYAHTDGPQLAFNPVAALYAMTVWKVADREDRAAGIGQPNNPPLHQFERRSVVAGSHHAGHRVFIGTAYMPEAARFVQSLDPIASRTRRIVAKPLLNTGRPVLEFRTLFTSRPTWQLRGSDLRESTQGRCRV